MSVFVDTSAMYSLLDADDAAHATAAAWFASARDEELWTHQYAVVETAALAQRRLGAPSVRALFDELLAPLDVVPISPDVHERGGAAYLAGLSSRVSLVDRVSFQAMRDRGSRRAFAFDRDFRREGFELVV